MGAVLQLLHSNRWKAARREAGGLLLLHSPSSSTLALRPLCSTCLPSLHVVVVVCGRFNCLTSVSAAGRWRTAEKKGEGTIN